MKVSFDETFFIVVACKAKEVAGRISEKMPGLFIISTKVSLLTGRAAKKQEKILSETEWGLPLFGCRE